MTLTLVTGSSSEPVSLDQAKQHLRVDHSDEDELIASLITSASRKLDGRDGELSRALISQTWALSLGRFPAEISLPLPPCQSVTSIAYVDENGVAQTLDAANYTLVGAGGSGPASIVPSWGNAWPSTRDVPEAVTVTFVAGYGDDPLDVPEPIRTAIKMIVAHLYEHREAVISATGFVKELPLGVEDHLANFRVRAF